MRVGWTVRKKRAWSQRNSARKNVVALLAPSKSVFMILDYGLSKHAERVGVAF